MTVPTITSAEVGAWLDQASVPESFTFRPNGTLSTITRNGSTLSPPTTIDGQYVDFGGPVTSDADGRVHTTPAGWTFRYDGLGRVREATNGSSTSRFAYDGLDRLVHFDGTSFQYAGSAIIREVSAGNTVLYVPGENGGPIAAVTDSGIAYNHYAFGGRLAYATDDAGALIEAYRYSAFGEPTIVDPAGEVRAESTVGNRMLLMGQPYFPAFGLYRQGARWLNPTWGAFLTPDPLGFADGPNRFAYVGGHPILWVDPTGLGAAVLTDTGMGHMNAIDDCALIGCHGKRPDGDPFEVVMGQVNAANHATRRRSSLRGHELRLAGD
jgi:RHS repeat-associated protein